MPYYKYVCSVCKDPEEMMRPVTERDNPLRCLNCDAPMERVKFVGQTHKPARNKQNPPYPIPRWF